LLNGELSDLRLRLQFAKIGKQIAQRERTVHIACVEGGQDNFITHAALSPIQLSSAWRNQQQFAAGIWLIKFLVKHH
jgi:hypothetical protein